MVRTVPVSMYEARFIPHEVKNCEMTTLKSIDSHLLSNPHAKVDSEAYIGCLFMHSLACM